MRLLKLIFSFSILRIALSADTSTPCNALESRIICESSNCIVLGERWLWSSSNVIVDRQDPSFKKEVVAMLKKSKEWNSIKKDFDKSFQDSDPSFLLNIYVALVGIRSAEKSIGFKNDRWLFYDKKYLCKTAPLECFLMTKTPQKMDSRQVASATTSFLKLKKQNKIDEFCDDIKRKQDTVFSRYQDATAKCSPKWPSLEKYCDSILKVFAELSQEKL